MQHVVEIADVGEADAGRTERRLDAPRARRVERPAQVERVRDRVEHRLGRHIRLGWMERG
jgi:hypothetical protein